MDGDISSLETDVTNNLDSINSLELDLQSFNMDILTMDEEISSLETLETSLSEL